MRDTIIRSVMSLMLKSSAKPTQRLAYGYDAQRTDLFLSHFGDDLRKQLQVFLYELGEFDTLI
jgi:hypothetical protein